MMLNKFRPLGKSMFSMMQRGYLTQLGLDHHALVERQTAGKESAALELWKEQKKKN